MFTRISGLFYVVLSRGKTKDHILLSQGIADCLLIVCVLMCIYSHMQCMSIVLCTLSHFSRIQLFVTLWTVALPRFLCPWDSPGKNTGSGLPFPTPGALSDPGIKPVSLTSPALAGGFFTTEPPVLCLSHSVVSNSL